MKTDPRKVFKDDAYDMLDGLVFVLLLSLPVTEA